MPQEDIYTYPVNPLLSARKKCRPRGAPNATNSRSVSAPHRATTGTLRLERREHAEV